METKTHKHNWLSHLFKGISLATVAFAFQACYGQPRDFGRDKLMEGVVKDRATDLPIEGIKVALDDNLQYTSTDANGRFRMYTSTQEKYMISLTNENQLDKTFLNRDTIIESNIEKENVISVTLFMDKTK